MADVHTSAPWELTPRHWPAQDMVGFGGTLETGRLVAAYRRGIFPMPIEHGPVGWWSPMRRGVLPLDRLRVTRSMRQSAKRFQTSIDRAFGDVLAGCADPQRSGGWIDERIAVAYRRLFDEGHVHSVEVWRNGALAGGLYGVAIGGLFAGESMFSTERDASKVALMELVRLLDDGHPDRLVDTQWQTRHLASLGVIEVSRREFLRRLEFALQLPLPAAFSGRVTSEPRR
jgi:leucyl/phenylalanyl-tRNA--protein transferase